MLAIRGGSASCSESTLGLGGSWGSLSAVARKLAGHGITGDLHCAVLFQVARLLNNAPCSAFLRLRFWSTQAHLQCRPLGAHWARAPTGCKHLARASTGRKPAAVGPNGPSEWAGQIFIKRAGWRTAVLKVTSDDTVAS